jgi:hypothetical protein
MKLRKLLEAKSIGKIYHLVSLNSMRYIMKHDVLESYNFSGISTTRNKNLTYYVGDRQNYFRLVLDGDKLSDKFQINPFSYKSVSGSVGDEMEEKIKTQKITNISKYIIEIQVLQHQIDHVFKMLDDPDEDRTEFLNGILELVADVKRWKVPTKIVNH